MPPAESAMLEKNYLWRVYWRLAGVIMLCVVLALAVVSYFSHNVFERQLIPETEQKAATVAASVRALVLKAIASGVPFDQLYGVEQTFGEVFEENPEFKYAALTDVEGKLLHHRGKEPAGVREYFTSPKALAVGLDPTASWLARASTPSTSSPCRSQPTSPWAWCTSASTTSSSPTCCWK
jgi:hypothetical protein